MDIPSHPFSEIVQRLKHFIQSCTSDELLFIIGDLPLFSVKIKNEIINEKNKDLCSVRLTWDVFVRGLNRQLGTPSHWLPADSCKEGQKGRPSGRLHSDAQVSQQETPKKLSTSVSEHRVWHSEGDQREIVSSVYFLLLAKTLP